VVVLINDRRRVIVVVVVVGAGSVASGVTARDTSVALIPLVVGAMVWLVMVIRTGRGSIGGGCASSSSPAANAATVANAVATTMPAAASTAGGERRSLAACRSGSIASSSDMRANLPRLTADPGIITTAATMN
jgi:hypothetical protein